MMSQEDIIMATNKHNKPDITVQTGNFMAPYKYLGNKHREHVTFDDMIPTMFNLEVKYKNMEDYLDAIDSLIQRYQDHKTDPDILSGLKSISNYNFIASDKNKTILIKVNLNDHITSDFPISDILRVYMNALIYRVMTYEELLENLATTSGKNETGTGTLKLKDLCHQSDTCHQSGIDIRKELKKQEDQYNKEVNEDMEKNREQWEEIVRQAENQSNLVRQADESNESNDNLVRQADDNESLTDLATISSDPDIQVKLDVIEDLLSDIRDNLKDQERKRLYINPTTDTNEKKLNNIVKKSENNKFNGKSAISLISWDENQVTALFLGDPSVLIKASFDKNNEIIATVQTDICYQSSMDKLSKQDLFVQVIDSRGLDASVIIDDKSHVVVEIKSKDPKDPNSIKVEDSLPMIAQMAVLVYQLKTISEEDLIDIENNMDIFIADHTLAEAGWEKL